MTVKFAIKSTALLLASALLAAPASADSAQSQQSASRVDSAATHHRTIRVDGAPVDSNH